MRVLVLLFLFLVNCTFLFAQGDPYYNDYKSIFDFEEEDLYLNYINRPLHISEDKTYSTGSLFGYSIPVPSHKPSSEESGGVPDPPVNCSALFICLQGGIMLSVLKLNQNNFLSHKKNFLLCNSKSIFVPIISQS